MRRVVTMTVVACIAGLVGGIALLWFLFTRGSHATTLSEADFDTEYDELVAKGEAAASDRDAAWRDFDGQQVAEERERLRWDEAGEE